MIDQHLHNTLTLHILDHGYVKYIEAGGTGVSGKYNVTATDPVQLKGLLQPQVLVEQQPDYERGIIEAARQSTQGAFRGWQEDGKLLGTLFNNDPPHTTPFEFGDLTLEVQAPLMVFREWQRHRTQSYNEMSARYAPLPNLYYQPFLGLTLQRAEKARASKNKQEQGTTREPLDADDIEGWLERGKAFHVQLEQFYHAGLDIGIPKELARYNMPVCHYSRMRAKGNLWNWLRFVTLRDHPKAMHEIREYGTAVDYIISQVFPRTWELFQQARVKYTSDHRECADCSRMVNAQFNFCPHCGAKAVVT